VDIKVKDGIINKLNKNIPLTTTHGMVLKYLGMPLDNTTKLKLKISMYKCIDKMLTNLPSDKGWLRHLQQYLYST